ncbi:MAG: transketolase [Clostridia bacterium]|nr:transketolase [Clostridia bacterium]
MGNSMIEDLKIYANKIRKLSVNEIYNAQSGHVGGAFSIADILAVLYFEEMKVDPKKPDWSERDRFVLSKGHASAALYATLALKGYFPEKDLAGFRKIDSYLEGHPCMKVPGVDINSGSLGQGLSIANGMALAAKLDKKNYRVFSIIGDGECNEGQIWEAAQTAAHHKLDNLCLFVDANGFQLDARTSDVKLTNPLDEKFEKFGWNVININGNDIEQVLYAFEVFNITNNKPTAVICKTVKGSGSELTEGKAEWHGKAPNEEEYNKIMADLEVVRL